MAEDSVGVMKQGFTSRSMGPHCYMAVEVVTRGGTIGNRNVKNLALTEVEVWRRRY